MRERGSGLPPAVVADVVSWYLDYQSTYRAPGTVRGCRSVLTRFLERSGIGDQPIAALTLDVARDYIRERLRDEGRTGPVRPATVNVEIRTLKALCRWAVDEGILSAHPLERLGQLRVAQGTTPRYLTWSQIGAILSHLSETYRSIVAVAALTGLRKGELFRLRWEDIDRDRMRIHVAAEVEGRRSKTYAARWVPMDPRVLEALPAQPVNGSPYIWPGRRGGQRSSNANRINDAIRKAAQTAGIDEAVTLHWLRHSFATHLVGAGASIEAVGKILGHRNRSTTEVYTHLQDDHLRQALGKLHGEKSKEPVDDPDPVGYGSGMTRTTTPTASTNIGLRLPHDIVGELDALAELVGQKRSTLARALLLDALDRILDSRGQRARTGALLDVVRRHV